MSEPQNTSPEEGATPLPQENPSTESGRENVQAEEPVAANPEENPPSPEVATGNAPKKARSSTGTKKPASRKKSTQEEGEATPKKRTRKPKAAKTSEPALPPSPEVAAPTPEEPPQAPQPVPEPPLAESDKAAEAPSPTPQEARTEAKVKKETFFGNILLLVTVAVFGGGLLYGGYTVLVKRGKLPAWGTPAPKVVAQPTATPVSKPNPTPTPAKESEPRPELLGFSVSEERKPHTLYPTKSSQFTAIQTKVIGTAFSATDAKKVYLVVENPDDPQADPICAETRTTGIISRVKSGEIKIGDAARITLGELNEKTKSRYEADRKTISNTYKVPENRFFDIEEYEILTATPSPTPGASPEATPNASGSPTPPPADPAQIFLQGTTTEPTP